MHMYNRQEELACTFTVIQLQAFILCSGEVLARACTICSKEFVQNKEFVVDGDELQFQKKNTILTYSRFDDLFEHVRLFIL